MESCRVCGEAHDESIHGEAETVLQPSLHSMKEYAGMVFDECTARGIKVWDLINELQEDEEWIHDLINDAIQRLTDAGYPVVEEDDTFLIYRKGE